MWGQSPACLAPLTRPRPSGAGAGAGCTCRTRLEALGRTPGSLSNSLVLTGIPGDIHGRRRPVLGQVPLDVHVALLAGPQGAEFGGPPSLAWLGHSRAPLQGRVGPWDALDVRGVGAEAARSARSKWGAPPGGTCWSHWAAWRLHGVLHGDDCYRVADGAFSATLSPALGQSPGTGPEPTPRGLQVQASPQPGALRKLSSGGARGALRPGLEATSPPAAAARRGPGPAPHGEDGAPRYPPCQHLPHL